MKPVLARDAGHPKRETRTAVGVATTYEAPNLCDGVNRSHLVEPPPVECSLYIGEIVANA